ncbi:MAG: ECF transporter S component [Clostridia bacterium]|nr:ECF transporter S component [Clostridia bacterium]
MKGQKRKHLLDLVLASMFLSLAVILPTITMNIKEIADSLLLMHLPIMLCGLICGAEYGLAAGFMAPIIRSLIFTMPPLYPRAIYMALELATYGFVLGLLYKKSKGKIYVSLISSQIAGRIVWAISKTLLLGFSHEDITFKAFLVGGFLDAIPGIALQLVLIPLIMLIVKKTKLKT